MCILFDAGRELGRDVLEPGEGFSPQPRLQDRRVQRFREIVGEDAVALQFSLSADRARGLAGDARDRVRDDG